MPLPLKATELKGKDWRWPEPRQPHGDVYLQIIFPWAVVVPDNGGAKYGVVKGRMILSKRYREAKEKAHAIALLSCGGQRFGEGCVRVSVNVHPPDARKRDITNTLKLLCDAMSGAAYTDDRQIVWLDVKRHAVARDDHPLNAPRIIVLVDAAPCPDCP